MSAQRVSPAALPAAVIEKVDAQRRRLQCAAELLACVAVAYDAGRDFEFSDAMLAVRDMIDAAVTALDRVELRRAPEPSADEDDD